MSNKVIEPTRITVVQFLTLEDNLSRLMVDVRRLKEVAANHGEMLKEALSDVNNKVSKAELMAAMATVRYQNRKSAATSNDNDEEEDDLYDGGLGRLKKTVKRLEADAKQREKKFRDDMKKSEIELQAAKQESQATKKEIFALTIRVNDLSNQLSQMNSLKKKGRLTLIGGGGAPSHRHSHLQHNSHLDDAIHTLLGDPVADLSSVSPSMEVVGSDVSSTTGIVHRASNLIHRGPNDPQASNSTKMSRKTMIKTPSMISESIVESNTDDVTEANNTNESKMFAYEADITPKSRKLSETEFPTMMLKSKESRTKKSRKSSKQDSISIRRNSKVTAPLETNSMESENSLGSASTRRKSKSVSSSTKQSNASEIRIPIVRKTYSPTPPGTAENPNIMTNHHGLGFDLRQVKSDENTRNMDVDIIENKESDASIEDDNVANDNQEYDDEAEFEDSLSDDSEYTNEADTKTHAEALIVSILSKKDKELSKRRDNIQHIKKKSRSFASEIMSSTMQVVDRITGSKNAVLMMGQLYEEEVNGIVSGPTIDNISRNNGDTPFVHDLSMEGQSPSKFRCSSVVMPGSNGEKASLNPATWNNYNSNNMASIGAQDPSSVLSYPTATASTGNNPEMHAVVNLQNMHDVNREVNTVTHPPQIYQNTNEINITQIKALTQSLLTATQHMNNQDICLRDIQARMEAKFRQIQQHMEKIDKISIPITAAANANIHRIDECVTRVSVVFEAIQLLDEEHNCLLAAHRRLVNAVEEKDAVSMHLLNQMATSIDNFQQFYNKHDIQIVDFGVMLNNLAAYTKQLATYMINGMQGKSIIFSQMDTAPHPHSYLPELRDWDSLLASLAVVAANAHSRFTVADKVARLPAANSNSSRKLSQSIDPVTLPADATVTTVPPTRAIPTLANDTTIIPKKPASVAAPTSSSTATGAKSPRPLIHREANGATLSTQESETKIPESMAISTSSQALYLQHNNPNQHDVIADENTPIEASSKNATVHLAVVVPQASTTCDQHAATSAAELIAMRNEIDALRKSLDLLKLQIGIDTTPRAQDLPPKRVSVCCFPSAVPNFPNEPPSKGTSVQPNNPLSDRKAISSKLFESRIKAGTASSFSPKKLTPHLGTHATISSKSNTSTSSMHESIAKLNATKLSSSVKIHTDMMDSRELTRSDSFFEELLLDQPAVQPLAPPIKQFTESSKIRKLFGKYASSERTGILSSSKQISSPSATFLNLIAQIDGRRNEFEQFEVEDDAVDNFRQHKIQISMPWPSMKEDNDNKRAIATVEIEKSISEISDISES